MKILIVFEITIFCAVFGGGDMEQNIWGVT